MASEPDRPTDAASPRTRPGSITLARHGEPALSRRIRLNAEGYRRWWAAYEEGGILPGQTPPDGLKRSAHEAQVVLASTRRRAVETARAVAGGRAFQEDPVFVEAPLPPPPFPAFVRLSPKTWGFLARVAWWFFGHTEGQESRAQAQARTEAAVDRLVDAARTQGDVLVLAHGFFNTMLARELRRRGWRMVEHEGYGYWGRRRFERR
jgi:broad specificity phosphatase PhoE